MPPYSLGFIMKSLRISCQLFLYHTMRDIKKDIDNGEQPGEAVTAAMFQAMRDALAEQKQKPLSIDDVTAMIAGQIGQLAPMDEETADLFQKLLKKVMKQKND